MRTGKSFLWLVMILLFVCASGTAGAATAGKPVEFLSNTELKRLNTTGRTQIELLSRPLTALTSFVLFLFSMIVNYTQLILWNL
jgi:hypothetical protein